MIPSNVFESPLITGPIYRNTQSARSPTSKRLDEIAYIIFSLYFLAVTGKECIDAYNKGERFLPGITAISAVAILALSVVSMLCSRDI